MENMVEFMYVNICDNFPIQNDLKTRRCFIATAFNITSEYAIRSMKTSWDSNEVEYIQLLASADDVNLLGNDIDTIKKSTGTLTDAAKEVGLEVNIEKTKYTLLI
jgi:hypothetical protein